MILARLSAMGRPLRRHAPGQVHLVTTRCHQAQFLLRPDPALNDAILEWLTRAQMQFPRVRILAVCVMSNHIHLVVRDENAELAAWSSYFLGHLARAVNRIRGRTGAVFERRYSSEPILDDEALVDRVVYVVTNPVSASLCSRVREWPGVLLVAPTEEPLAIDLSWVDRSARSASFGSRRFAGRKAPGHAEASVDATLTIDPVFRASGPPSRMSAAIEARERELGLQRRRERRRVFGRHGVLAQSWRAAPRDPKRRPRPICHAADPTLRRRFREGYSHFVSLFREASERLREGDPHPRFPEWSYPPGRPLIRPFGVFSGTGLARS